MPNDSEVIHVHVYDPTHRIFKEAPKRASAIVISCARAGECDAYKNGKCILVHKPFGPRCFGRQSHHEGPTRRAKAFRGFISRWKDHEKYGALEMQPNKVFRVGDGYFMPYAHIDLMESSPFEKHSGFFASGFPYLENPTAEALSTIYTQRPQALMGGEIKDYQAKIVPQIVKHLHDEYPELYQRLLSVHPEASENVENFDYTGKKAVLSTLLPGEIKISKNRWTWDGEVLTGPGSNMIFAPANAEEVIVKPGKDAVVKVTDPGMVGPDTTIID